MYKKYKNIEMHDLKILKKHKLDYIINLINENNESFLSVIINECEDTLYCTYLARDGWGISSRIHHDSFESFCAEDVIFWLEFDMTWDCKVPLPDNKLKEKVYEILKEKYE